MISNCDKIYLSNYSLCHEQTWSWNTIVNVHERGQSINYILLYTVYKENTSFTDLLTKYRKCKQMALLIAIGIKLIFNW